MLRVMMESPVTMIRKSPLSRVVQHALALALAQLAGFARRPRLFVPLPPPWNPRRLPAASSAGAQSTRNAMPSP